MVIAAMSIIGGAQPLGRGRYRCAQLRALACYALDVGSTPITGLCCGHWCVLNPAQCTWWHMHCGVLLYAPDTRHAVCIFPRALELPHRFPPPAARADSRRDPCPYTNPSSCPPLSTRSCVACERSMGHGSRPAPGSTSLRACCCASSSRRGCPASSPTTCTPTSRGHL